MKHSDSDIESEIQEDIDNLVTQIGGMDISENFINIKPETKPENWIPNVSDMPSSSKQIPIRKEFNKPIQGYAAVMSTIRKDESYKPYEKEAIDKWETALRIAIQIQNILLLKMNNSDIASTSSSNPRTAQRGDIGYTSKPIFSKGIPLLTYQSNENVLDYQVNLRRLDLDIEDIKQRLKQCYTENPLQFWDKNQITAKLEMKDKEKEIRVKPMRYNPEDQKEFMIQTKELLDLKLIRISHSPHSSPAFMVRKHSEIARGKARMVINYKKLNDNTVFDGYFLPHKESLINWTTDKKIFSKFDCKSGFWQIKMHPDSILYTSFSTPQGQYEWLVMPFGLKNAPQIFQRKMDSIFKDYDFIFVYVDDILILSDNIESHLKHLDIFIELCIKNGLALSEKKTKLIQEQIDFLGMKIDGNGIELQSHILEKINSFPDKLVDKKQVQSFLGILNYASDFIKNLALLRKPFQDLLKKNKVFSFDKSLENQVKKIKEYCKILPKLQLPKDNDDLILETDASENYWSGVLKKIDYNSEQEKIGESICRYCSGTFTDTQTRYHINEKELLAVVKSCQKLFYFLLPKKFLLRTDNTQVKAFIKNNLPSKPEYKRLIRWQTLLSEYNFDIEIIKSDKNVLADFLTRDGKDD
ncbi:hypothetical protein OSB04_un000538 [Centaurea solstitialis]|uniref:Reverse transcriptase domain-containing protein n=1 Tax=Centaurea solstitialis TaxID=347529 RepID=A0AA38SNF3_9ASTR|nr:hypothetical protein OSB04_un000536 [Centaurea solstitialis]KAJ9536291.1 hypothetical protein OSB04_un000537 [Centaurea solstitialis]KAJ9536292.1 hypothetical protein OSB04_un000538 [Centaurea solstitialis]